MQLHWPTVMSATLNALRRGATSLKQVQLLNMLRTGRGCWSGCGRLALRSIVVDGTSVGLRYATSGSEQRTSSAADRASGVAAEASSPKREFRPRTILRSQTPVEELIRGRGERVYQIAANDTMNNALKKMFIHNIGCLLVVEQALQNDEACKPVGIITERDLTRLLISRGSSGNVSAGDTTADLLMTVKVHEFMTKANALISVTPDTDLASVLELMASRRLRHLPVVRDGQAIGMVSIGDVVRRLIEESREEADALKEYIAGTY